MNENHARLEYSKRSKIFLVNATHFLITIGMFYITWIIFRYHVYPQGKDSGYRYNYFVTGGFTVLFFFFSRTYNAYLLGYSRMRTLVFAQALSQGFSITIIYFVVSLGWNKFKNPLVFLALIMALGLVDIGWVICANRYYFRLNPPRKTLLIYRNNQDIRRFGSISGKPTEKLYKIVKEIEFDGTFDEIREKLGEYEAVFVAGVNSHCRNGILKYCEENGIRGFFLPHVGDVIMQGAEHIQSFDSPVLMVQRKILQPEYRVVKRIFDIIISACGLVFLSPIFLIAIIAIKGYDGGPAFYKQIRLTRNERQFKIIKFRSMRVDAEKDGVARLSTGENDDRITPIGKLLRKYRLDELPQLWNILMGEMSIVGPRPERPEIAEKYYQRMPEFKLRLQVKAGLTGYAQVYGKYNTDPYEKLEFDLMYINHMSMLTDLELIFSTVGILFSSESTQGIKQGGMTAMDYEDERAHQ